MLGCTPLVHLTCMGYCAVTAAALHSKQLRDPFAAWPEIDIMEVEVSSESGNSTSDLETDDCANEV